jgi:prolyl-tRNA editing enzyme YbaK/EbsC (Cys-tRNA(Pro) deacylase)
VKSPVTAPVADNTPHEGFDRVRRLLAEAGHAHAPVWLDVPARTCEEAAQALGLHTGQIAKSVIFRRRADEAAVLVIASGDLRVDEQKVAALVGPIGRADAAFVKLRTGFSIGGVSPLGHVSPPVVLIDRELFRFDEVWAAAGHPHGVFKAAPDQLPGLSGGVVADVVTAPAVRAGGAA